MSKYFELTVNSEMFFIDMAKEGHIILISTWGDGIRQYGRIVNNVKEADIMFVPNGCFINVVDYLENNKYHYVNNKYYAETGFQIVHVNSYSSYIEGKRVRCFNVEGGNVYR